MTLPDPLRTAKRARALALASPAVAFVFASSPSTAHATSMGGAGIVYLMLLIMAANAFIGLLVALGGFLSGRSGPPSRVWALIGSLYAFLNVASGGFLLWAVPGSAIGMTLGATCFVVGVINVVAAGRVRARRASQH